MPLLQFSITNKFSVSILAMNKYYMRSAFDMLTSSVGNFQEWDNAVMLMRIFWQAGGGKTNLSGFIDLILGLAATLTLAKRNNAFSFS